MSESFELTADQLAAAHQLAGISQADFGQAPAPDVLAPTAALAADGTLRPELAAVLRVVEEPAVLVQAVANRVGEPVWTQAWVASAGRSPLVVQTQTETSNVYRPADDARAAADALLDVSGTPTMGGDGGALPTLALELPGFAALVALADAVSAEVLRSRLERRPADLHGATSSTALAEQLDRGAASVDSSWLVTAALPITPVDLRSTRDRLDEGLGELARAGLLTDDGDGRAVTPTGRAVLDSLGDATATFGAYYPLTGPDGQPTLDHLAVLSGRGTTWVGRWSQVSATHGAVELRPGSAEQAADEVRALVGRAHDVALAGVAEREAAAAAARAAEEAAREQERLAAEQAAHDEAMRRDAERRDAERREAERMEAERMQAEHREAERMEAERVAAAAAVAPAPVGGGEHAPPWTPEPVAEAAPASDAWTPSHRVPTVGMWAWTEPDPAAQPAAALDPHLEVQAAEHRGEWVRIICSNGWQAWVDGRQLVDR